MLLFEREGIEGRGCQRRDCFNAGITMMLGNGTTRKYQFDSRGQLTTQIEYSGATPLCTIVDGYDPVGNRLTRNLDGNPITWSYDDLYRLTGQQKAGQVCTYTLDGVGNLLTMWEGGSFPKTFTHNAADRLVTMVEGADLSTFTYSGFLALATMTTGNQTTSYAYSGQDQLVSELRPSGQQSTYTFDGDGLRRTAWEHGAAGSTTVVWDGSDYLYLAKPGGNRNQTILTLESEIVHAGGKDLLTDPLGSLVKEVSSGASLGSLIEMYPYGSLVAGTGSATTPYVYIGAYGYFRDTAERDYVRARELYGKLGRWMQVDPLWPEDDVYGYCSASPSQYVDSLGMCKDCKRGYYTGSPGETCFCLDCIHGTSGEATRVNDLLYHKIGPWKGIPPPFTNDQMNAIRHCYWSCISVQECGCICAQMIDDKELIDRGGNDSKADLCNNCIGRELGDVRSTGCLNACIRALREGRLCSAKTGLPYGFIGPPWR